MDEIHNFIRGLSPYPAAWAEMKLENGKLLSMKIYEVEKVSEEHSFGFGLILFEEGDEMRIAVSGGFIVLKTMQQAGKKRMAVADFLRGFQNTENCTMV